jgi:hypothetical protein
MKKKEDKNQRPEVRGQRSENEEKVAESGPELRIKDQGSRIEVEVIQAHEEDLPGGGYRRIKAGGTIEIDAADFCDNVHKRVNS